MDKNGSEGLCFSVHTPRDDLQCQLLQPLSSSYNSAHLLSIHCVPSMELTIAHTGAIYYCNNSWF